MAVAEAIRRWSSYLGQRQFIIRTDHQSLKYFLDQKVITCLQRRWMSKLLGYYYIIADKKGKDNTAADSLSRKFEEGTSQEHFHEDMKNFKGKGMSSQG